MILIEADLRRPGIGPALDLQAKYGVASVLVESVALKDALVTTPTFGANLGILLADYEGGWISDLFALPAARELIADARRMADFVIIDSPPLTDVIDALPLVDYVDDVVLVAGIGKTHLRKLAQLGELLAEQVVRPGGVRCGRDPEAEAGPTITTTRAASRGRRLRHRRSAQTGERIERQPSGSRWSARLSRCPLRTSWSSGQRGEHIRCVPAP